MKTRQEYKQISKDSLVGQYWNYVVLALIYFAISYAIGGLIALLERQEAFTALGTLLAIVVDSALGYGLITYALKFVKKENPVYGDLFEAFNDNKVGKVLGTSLLVKLFTFLWSLLLIVPGIIKGLGWSMTIYILRENPDRTPRECMAMSEEMMMGHKWEFFLLNLSFIGWILLAALTAGVGLVFLYPWLLTTITNYYEDLKKEYNSKHTNVEVKVEDAPKQEEQKPENKEEENKEK